MPKIANPLNDLQVRRITRVGWHAVGGVAGLLLQVRNPAKQGAAEPDATPDLAFYCRQVCMKLCAGQETVTVVINPLQARNRDGHGQVGLLGFETQGTLLCIDQMRMGPSPAKEPENQAPNAEPRRR